MLIQILAQKRNTYYYSTSINKALQTKYNLGYDSKGNANDSVSGYGANLVGGNGNFPGNSVLQGGGMDGSDDRDLILMGLDESISSLIHNLLLRLGHFRKIDVSADKSQQANNVIGGDEDPHCILIESTTLYLSRILRPVWDMKLFSKRTVKTKKDSKTIIAMTENLGFKQLELVKSKMTDLLHFFILNEKYLFGSNDVIVRDDTINNTIFHNQNNNADQEIFVQNKNSHLFGHNAGQNMSSFGAPIITYNHNNSHQMNQTHILPNANGNAQPGNFRFNCQFLHVINQNQDFGKYIESETRFDEFRLGKDIKIFIEKIIGTLALFQYFVEDKVNLIQILDSEILIKFTRVSMKDFFKGPEHDDLLTRSLISIL